MKNKNSENSIVNSKSEFLSIHDCLKMIGMKEATANIYVLPARKHIAQQTANRL